MNNINSFSDLCHLIETRIAKQQAQYVNGKLLILNSIDANQISEGINKVNMIILGLCTSGHCTINIDLRSYTCGPGSLLCITPNRFFQFVEISPDCKGDIVLVENSVLDEVMTRLNDLFGLFVYVRWHPSILLNQDEQALATYYMNLILSKNTDKGNLFVEPILRNLLLSWFYEICNIYSRRVLQSNVETTHHEELLQRFAHELSQHYKEERTVKFYAAILQIDAKYLSEICHNVTGRYASELIDSYVIMEAKVLLWQTKMSIKQIAADLHFPDQAAFGKYFKRLEEMSPRDYRHKVRLHATNTD